MTEPQYQYATPIEDTEIVRNVIKRAMDTPVTISMRELLLIAPEV